MRTLSGLLSFFFFLILCAATISLIYLASSFRACMFSSYECCMFPTARPDWRGVRVNLAARIIGAFFFKHSI